MVEHIRVVPDKCRACRRCEVACIAAHHDMSFKEAMKHRDAYVSRVQVVKAEGLKTTVRCHQCDPAPCCNICPTGALQQDENGRIVMHDEKCVACEMCIHACPYGTISLDHLRRCHVEQDEPDDLPACQLSDRQVAVRCDMCHAWRIVNGKKVTACMEACPVGALYMIDADGTKVEMPKPVKKAVEKKPSAEASKAEDSKEA